MANFGDGMIVLQTHIERQPTLEDQDGFNFSNILCNFDIQCLFFTLLM